MRSLICVLTVTFLSLGLLIAPGASGVETDSDDQKFWHSFRQAVLEENYAKISSMTRFPFPVRGPDDSDPVKLHDQKSFLQALKKLLSQPVSLVSDRAIVTKTMIEVIRSKMKLARADYLNPETIRIHQFQFRHIEGRWLFTRAYLEDF